MLEAGGPAGSCGRPRPHRGCPGALALQPGAASHSAQASAAAQSSAALAGGNARCCGMLAAAPVPCGQTLRTQSHEHMRSRRKSL